MLAMTHPLGVSRFARFFECAVDGGATPPAAAPLRRRPGGGGGQRPRAVHACRPQPCNLLARRA